MRSLLEKLRAGGRLYLRRHAPAQGQPALVEAWLEDADGRTYPDLSLVVVAEVVRHPTVRRLGTLDGGVAVFGSTLAGGPVVSWTPAQERGFAEAEGRARGFVVRRGEKGEGHPRPARTNGRQKNGRRYEAEPDGLALPADGVLVSEGILCLGTGLPPRALLSGLRQRGVEVDETGGVRCYRSGPALRAALEAWGFEVAR